MLKRSLGCFTNDQPEQYALSGEPVGKFERYTEKARRTVVLVVSPQGERLAIVEHIE